jgi:hypothetical protein
MGRGHVAWARGMGHEAGEGHLTWGVFVIVPCVWRCQQHPPTFFARVHAAPTFLTRVHAALPFSTGVHAAPTFLNRGACRTYLSHQSACRTYLYQQGACRTPPRVPTGHGGG